MNYNICIPIPLRSNNLADNSGLIDRALAYNPEYIEFRFDYINLLEDLTPEFVEQLSTHIKNKTHSIFTFRHISEGGKSNIDETERLKILKMLINTQPDFFDIEMNSNKETLSTIINLSHIKEVKLIFSNHNFETTPTYQKAEELILKFEERVVKQELNEIDILDNCIYKIIFMAQTFEDNLIPLRLCKEFSKSPKKIISFCMGDLGLFSRVFCVRLGSFLTYAALQEKTAPGQISIETLKQVYKLLFND